MEETCFAPQKEKHRRRRNLSGDSSSQQAACLRPGPRRKKVPRSCLFWRSAARDPRSATRKADDCLQYRRRTLRRIIEIPLVVRACSPCSTARAGAQPHDAAEYLANREPGSSRMASIRAALPSAPRSDPSTWRPASAGKTLRDGRGSGADKQQRHRERRGRCCLHRPHRARRLHLALRRPQQKRPRRSGAPSQPQPAYPFATS